MEIPSITQHIEHTLLRSNAVPKDIDALCDEAIAWKFRGVCVNPIYIEQCKKRLSGSDVSVITVVGFPLGATSSLVKTFEARQAVESGADEIDMVMSVGLFLSEAQEQVFDDIHAVVQAVPKHVVKVIIETGFLAERQIPRAARIAVDAGAAFVKTCTGFTKGQARPEDIASIRKEIGPEFGIKASGGIRTYADAMTLLNAGATRLGTSQSVAIATEAQRLV